MHVCMHTYTRIYVYAQHCLRRLRMSVVDRFDIDDECDDDECVFDVMMMIMMNVCVMMNVCG